MHVPQDLFLDHPQTLSMDNMFLFLCMQISEDYHTILRQHIMAEFDEFDGINLREMRVLECIAQEKTAVTGAMVAQRLRYDRATVTRALKRLETHAFINRKPSPFDHRSELIDGTLEGKELAGRYGAKCDAVMSILSSLQHNSLTDVEIEQFEKIGRKLSQRVNSMRQIKPSEYAHTLS